MFGYSEEYYLLEWNVLGIIVIGICIGIIRWKMINRKKRKSTKIKRVVFIVIYLLIIFIIMTIATPIIVNNLEGEQRYIATKIAKALEMGIYGLIALEIIINSIVGFFKEDDVFLNNNDFI